LEGYISIFFAFSYYTPPFYGLFDKISIIFDIEFSNEPNLPSKYYLYIIGFKENNLKAEFSYDCFSNYPTKDFIIASFYSHLVHF
jgi:hypothetical protein